MSTTGKSETQHKCDAADDLSATNGTTKVEEEGIKDLEAEFQDSMKETAIESLNDPVEHDLEVHEEKTPPCSPTSGKWLVIGIMFALILAAIVVGVVLGGGESYVEVAGDSSDEDDTPSEAPAPLTDREYVEQLILFSLFPGGTSTDVLYSDSARKLALDWLVEVDEYLPRPFVDTMEDDEQVLLERFALTAFAFATGSTSSWTHSLNFLNATASVCDWNQVGVLGGFGGAECDPQGRVGSIRIENNNLVGTLPSLEFQALSFLRRLTLIGGNLQGSIPTQLARLGNVRGRLRLSNLGLTGTIPASFEANGKHFHTLDFSRNQLSGTISSDFVDDGDWRVVNLVVMDMSHNQFTGSLPVPMSQGLLRVYNMNDNRLEGTIPQSVYTLRELQSLQLGNNQLRGTLADQISLLIDLTTIDLQGNTFSGSIPSSLNRLDRLERLDLSSNHFSSLPNDFEGMDRLHYLSIASNPDIAGSLPSSLAQLTSLEQLIITDTNISDGLDFACSRRNDLDLLPLQLEADCGGISSKVDCPCCTKCCSGPANDGETPSCTANITATCNVARASLLEKDPRTSMCSCSSDGINLFCSDDQCEDSCSNTVDGTGDGTVCFDEASYGYTFDGQSGDPLVFQSVIEVAESSAGDVIKFSIQENLDDESCTVHVNNLRCRQCTRVFCDDVWFGTVGYDVVCDNLLLEGDGNELLPVLSFSTCSANGSWLQPQGRDYQSCIRHAELGNF